MELAKGCLWLLLELLFVSPAVSSDADFVLGRAEDSSRRACRVEEDVDADVDTDADTDADEVVDARDWRRKAPSKRRIVLLVTEDLIIVARIVWRIVGTIRFCDFVLHFDCRIDGFHEYFSVRKSRSVMDRFLCSLQWRALRIGGSCSRVDIFSYGNE